MRSSIAGARSCSARSSIRILRPRSWPNWVWLNGPDSSRPMTTPVLSTPRGHANPVGARAGLDRRRRVTLDRGTVVLVDLDPTVGHDGHCRRPGGLRAVTPDDLPTAPWAALAGEKIGAALSLTRSV